MENNNNKVTMTETKFIMPKEIETKFKELDNSINYLKAARLDLSSAQKEDSMKRNLLKIEVDALTRKVDRLSDEVETLKYSSDKDNERKYDTIRTALYYTYLTGIIYFIFRK